MEDGVYSMIMGTGIHKAYVAIGMSDTDDPTKQLHDEAHQFVAVTEPMLDAEADLCFGILQCVFSGLRISDNLRTVVTDCYRVTQHDSRVTTGVALVIQLCIVVTDDELLVELSSIGLQCITAVDSHYIRLFSVQEILE